MAHPNIYTPLGSQTWNKVGTVNVPSIGGQPGFNIPNYEQKIELSPEQQNLFNQQNQLSTGLLGLGNTSLDQVEGTIGTPLQPGNLATGVSSGPLNTSLPSGGPLQTNLNPGQVQKNVGTDRPIQGGLDRTFDRNRIEDALYNRTTSRLNPQWNQREQQIKTQLANQGLAPGGEAYTNAMRDFNFGRNDAYSNAMNDAIGMGGQEMSREFGIQQGTGQFANQAQQQAYNQALASGQFANQAQGQDYNQQLANAQLGNQAQQQQFNQGAQGAQFANQAQQQAYQQQMANAQLQNQAQQQGFQQQAYQRNLPLTELNAIRTGAQPQMPSFQASQYAGTQGPNYLGAANMQGQANQQMYQNQLGGFNGLMGGLFDLGGAAMGTKWFT